MLLLGSSSRLSLALGVLVLVTPALDAAPKKEPISEPRLILKGHAKGVFNVVYSPDGKLLATASRDKTLALWDSATGRKIRDLTGHTKPVYSCAFTPDGKRLVSASDDKTVRLWDVTTGKEIQSLKGHTGGVYNVAVSPDGKLIASGSYDHSVRLWDAATGKHLRTLHGHADRVIGIAFDPEGRWLATSSVGDSSKPQDEVRLWDVASGELITKVFGTQKGVVTVEFSPDGKRLVGTNQSKQVVVWETITGLETRVLKGHTQDVLYSVFSPDGRRLASCSGNWSGEKPGEVKVWDLPTGKPVLTLTGYKWPTWSLAFHPDGKQLAVCIGQWNKNDPGEVRIYDLSSLPRDNRPVVSVQNKNLEQWWADLGSLDAKKAYDAMWGLAAGSRKSMPFLLGKLATPPTATRDRISKLVNDLADEDFETREKASEELATLGAVARPALRDALGSSDPEVKQRARDLLAEQSAGLGLSTDEIRCLRAIEALEQMEGEDIRPALTKLAKGPETSPVVQHAKEALQRFRARTK